MKKTEKGSMSILSRIILGMFLLGILTAMYIDHYKTFKTRLNLQNILNNPEKYEGVDYQVMGRVIDTEKDFFYLLDTEANKAVRILYPSHSILKGNHMVVYGSFTSEGYMAAANIRFQDSEPFKYIISIIPAAYLILIFFKEWKLTKYGFEER